MIIKHTIIGNLPRNTKKPQLMLIGAWLESIGFGAGTFVAITYTDSSLILKSSGCDYHVLVHSMTADTPIIQVTNRLKRKISLPHLVLNGENLTRYGFDVGTPVIVYASSDTIHIKPINLLSYDFCSQLIMKKKICRVHRGIHRGMLLPKIQLTGTWLSQLGFTIEKLVFVNCSPHQITFKATDIIKYRHEQHMNKKERAKHITPHSLPSGKIAIRLQGLWLEALGFSIKTPFFVHYNHGIIQVTRLET